MASLHTVTEETKTIFRLLLILMVLTFVAFVVFRFGQQIKDRYYPTPPEPPTVLFGKLKPIAFPQNTTEKKLTYTIDTVSGDLPTFSDRINVYLIQKPQPNFLNLKRAEEKAARLGFPKQGSQISATDYIWTEILPPFRKLFFGTVSFNFYISSNFLTDQNLIQEFIGPIDTASTQTAATNLLTSIELFPNDIDITKTKTTLLSINNQQLVSATSLSQASLVRIDFFQKDINFLPIYYPNPPQSTLSFLFVGSRFNEKVIQAEFNHFIVDTTQSATYPIKTAEEATKELKDGKAYIASHFGDTTTIRITNVSVGYYMSNNPQDYLLPIIVFSGDNGFFAYVPAITDSWVQTPPVQK